MNRLLLLIGGGVVVVAVAAGAFWFLGARGSSPSSTPSTTSSSSTAESTSAPTKASGDFSGSFTDLLAIGGDRKCDWEGEMAGQEMQGTVYISGQKFRSEANSTIEGVGPFTAYVVGDGTTMTIWTSIAPGQKTTMAYNSMQDQATASDTAAFNQFKQQYNYRCSAWSADQGKFVVPQ